MNTRNAYHGLDENLKALAPKFEPPKLSFATSRSKSLLEEDDYFRANLPPTYDMNPEPLPEDETTVLGLMNEKCSKGKLKRDINEFPCLFFPCFVKGYENMVKDLSQAMRPAKEEKLVTPYRYQTITLENLGYSGANVDVKPYGIAKHHFVAEYDNELSLNEGDMVYLIRYVDNEWLEAELEAHKRGLVPISYINIIVDLMNVQHETAVTVHQNLLPESYHKVLYTFQGQMEGDLSVFEGEVVKIVEKQNDDWYVIVNSWGEAGLFPGNHLDPNVEMSGQALFDIDRLLTHKKASIEDRPSRPEKGPNQSQDKSWRFFDPLASPSADEELLKLEAILEEKARKANQGLVLEQRPDIIASTERKSRQPKDIESLISNNLSLLRSRSPSSNAQACKADGSNLTYDRLDVAKSVLNELR